MDQEDSIVVLDIGGGTVDLTYMSIKRQELDDKEDLVFRVRCTTGRRVGGEDVTGALAKQIVQAVQSTVMHKPEFQEKNCTFPTVLPQQEMAKIYVKAEEAKIALCAMGKRWEEKEHKIHVEVTCPSVKERLPNGQSVSGDPVYFCVQVKVSGEWLKEALAVLFNGIDAAWNEMRKYIETTKYAMPSKYVLVGGSSVGAPMTQFVANLTQGRRMATPQSVSTCIADGAMKYHRQMIDKNQVDVVLIDTVAKELGITYHDNVAGKDDYMRLISAHQTLPTRWHGQTFWTPKETLLIKVTVRAAGSGVGCANRRRARARDEGRRGRAPAGVDHASPALPQG